MEQMLKAPTLNNGYKPRAIAVAMDGRREHQANLALGNPL